MSKLNPEINVPSNVEIGKRPAEAWCAVADPWRYVPESHKTQHHGRERVVFIGPKAQGVLLRYLARDAQTTCFQPMDSEAKRRAEQHANRQTPLSCGTKPGDRRTKKPKRRAGAQYATYVYRRAITRACDAAFPAPEDIASDPAKLAVWQREHRWSPNQLRHTAGTEIRRQFGIEASRVTLGHSKISTTEIYSERDYNLAIQVARQVG